MRGSNCNLIIQQGEAEGFVPALYIETVNGQDPEAFSALLEKAVNHTLAEKYPGIQAKMIEGNRWILNIPDAYRVGHEAHFAQVTEKYLNYLVSGQMPDWEVPNMIVKYFTTTEGLKTARD